MSALQTKSKAIAENPFSEKQLFLEFLLFGAQTVG